jgi:hypothetical protein
MSQFMFLFRIDPEKQRAFLDSPKRAQEGLQAWMAWMRDLEAKGAIANPGQPLDQAGKVVRGPKRAITDGPFIEAKDLVAGFVVVEARDLGHAAELAGGCPILDSDGTVEVRPVRRFDM